jgi:enediyne biosynthesis protein E4
VSQPGTRNCSIEQPGELDAELGEFWAGSTWEIFQKHNLSCFERNRAYLNAGGESFVDISHLTGSDTDGDSRAVIPFDYNSDGRIDLAVRQAGGGPLLLYENDFPSHNYLKIVLRGRKSNRLAVGARVEAFAGKRRIVREAYPANTFRSQAPMMVHIGLDNAQTVDRLVVRWPTGVEQEWRDIAGNRLIVVTEGESSIETAIPGETISP